MYKISKTFPAKLGEVVSLEDLALNTKSGSFKKRVKRLFRKIFRLKSGQLEKDYWDILLNMISDPNDTFGLVGIDGYYTDVMGNDDLALVLNMGIPKLRGRKIEFMLE